MNARAIIEAESPKKAFRSMRHVVSSVLRQHGFEPFGSVALRKVVKDRVTGQLRRYIVWYDSPEAEWVVKQERFRPGLGEWADDSFMPFKTGEEVIAYLKGIRYVMEAESPKKALRQLSGSGPDDLEALLRRIKQQELIDQTPRHDSWEPGQRIRRIRHNVFGARPYGGNPNDIGDLGTVVRFLRRLPGPARAEYVCYWDRHLLSSEWTDHTKAEAIPGQFRQLDQWGRPV